MKNIRLQLLSFFISGFLWYFVSTNVSTVTLTVPIEITGTVPDQIITSPLPTQAQVRVSGPSFMVSGVLSSPPAFRIDTPKGTRRREVVPLLASDLAFPSIIKVLSISPSELEFKFEPKKSKVVDVTIPRVGTPRAGYQVSSIESSPKEVTISGPEGEVAAVSEVTSYPVDLRDAYKDSTQELPLKRPGLLTTLSTETVDVKVHIREMPTPVPTADLAVMVPSVSVVTEAKKRPSKR